MPIGIYEKDDIDAIAKSIRNGIGEETKYTTKQMPDKINEMQVYAYNNGHIEGYGEGRNEGYSMGRADGVTEGIEQGKTEAYAEVEPLNAELEQTLYGTDTGGKSFYDEFWDTYQDNGNRFAYYYAFAGFGWNDDSFNPKYNIIPKYYGIYCFCYSKITDIAESLKKCGVVLDTTLCTDFSAFFAYSKTKTVPLLNVAAATSTLTNLFNDCLDLITIEKLIVSENVRFHSSTFFRCEALENLTIEGTIGQNGFNVQWSTKLSHDSLMSIINALKDNSRTDTWNTITLGADNLAKLSQDELNIMHLKQWEYS